MKTLKPLEAALTDAGISLENLRTQIAQAAADIETFKPKGGNNFGGAWVKDIVAPDNEEGETWCAIINAPDGKTYEQDFKILAGKVSVAGDPREVNTVVTYTPAEASATEKLEAGDVEGHDFHFNQFTEAVGRAHEQSAAAEKLSKSADKKDTSEAHFEAMKAHAKAAQMHTTAAHIAKAAGDRISQRTHEALANDHERARVQQLQKAQSLMASSPEIHVPVESDAPVNQIFPLEGAAMMEAPTTPDKWKGFMAMAGGVQTMTLGCGGFPLQVTLDVDAKGAKALQAQLETIKSKSKQRPFNCFDHGGTKGQTQASSWPEKFFWKDGAKPGIYEAAEPSDTGAAAIAGKRYRGFSLTFFTDAEVKPLPKAKGPGFYIEAGAIGSPENPAHIICPEDVGENPEKYLNMGTLTNRPASVHNEPLFASQPNNLPPSSAAARNAGTTSGTNKNQTTMVKNETDIAALTARNEQLEQKIGELTAANVAENKAEIRALNAELEANQAKLDLAKSNEKIVQLEAAQKKQVEDTAEEAVREMIASQQIPKLDTELQASWKEKFIKDPDLIPLIVKKKGGNGRVTPSATAVALQASRVEGGFSVPGAMKKLLEIQTANARIMIHRGMSKSQLEAAYEEKGKLALQAGLFYKKELRGKEDEWDSIPGEELARCVGLEASAVAAPNRRALEAADYSDPNNQFGILNGTLVLQRTLPLFALEYPELMSMFTDFSDAPGQFEQTETTHIVIVPAVQKYNTALDANGRPVGFQVVSPAKTVDAPITLTDYIAVPIVIGQNILSSTVRRLFDEQSAAGMKAIAGYFTGLVTKLLTPANFNAYIAVTAPDGNGIVYVPVAYTTYARSLTDWSMNDLDKLSAVFTQNQVPRGDRGILLNTQRYAKLRSDPRLEFFFAAAKGDPQLTQQKLPDGLSGFFPYEAPYLPPGVPFFPYHKAGIMLKSRLPVDFTQALGVMIPGSVTTVTEPDSKMSVALVQRVDLTGNYAEWRPEVQLGAAVGDNRGGLCGSES